MYLLESIYKLFTGILTPLIAIITVIIAIQQQKTNKYKLKLDLYEKRYNIYLLVKNYILYIRVNKLNLNDTARFKREISEYVFLFNDDIKNYILQIISNSAELEICFSMIDTHGVSDEEIGEATKRRAELLIWFNDTYNKLETIFKVYLNFRKII